MSKVELVFAEGPLAGRRFEFRERDVFLVGRDADCHATIEDPYLSRHHCAIEIAPPLVLLRDLASRNGTVVNGLRHGGRRRGNMPQASSNEAVLKDGDVVRVGRTSFFVRIGSPGAHENAPQTQTESFDESQALTLAGYRLMEQLGSGATGTTWLAQRAADSAPVALKVIHFGTDVDPGVRARVLREAELLATVQHRNVVRLVDSGTFGDAYFLVLEYCGGGSVASLLDRRGRLLWPETRTIAFGMLAGLACAHERGIVHRDLKPDNVLLVQEADGVCAKVADFGLAKLSDALAPPSGVTLAGSSAGTPGYMPREQLLEFRTLRPVSDVWSAGATIYRMLTGDLPRERLPGQDAIQVVLEGRIIPIRERLPNLQRPLAAVIDRALATDPRTRFPSAVEMLAGLEAADRSI